MFNVLMEKLWWCLFFLWHQSKAVSKHSVDAPTSVYTTLSPLEVVEKEADSRAMGHTAGASRFPYIYLGSQEVSSFTQSCV
jgi:hypothetical protein